MKWLAKCQSEERQLGTWMVLPFMSKNGSFGSLSSPLKLSHKKMHLKMIFLHDQNFQFYYRKKEKNMSKMKVSCHELTEDRQKRKPKSSAVYLMCLTQVYSEFLLGLSRLLKHTCASANSLFQSCMYWTSPASDWVCRGRRGWNYFWPTRYLTMWGRLSLRKYAAEKPVS